MSSEARCHKFEGKLRDTIEGAESAHIKCRTAEENLRQMKLDMEEMGDHEEESLRSEIKNKVSDSRPVFNFESLNSPRIKGYSQVDTRDLKHLYVVI